MNRSLLYPILALPLLALLSGCRTVTVRKVTDGSEAGIRYALPMTVFTVAPDAGAGYTVTEHTLPDSSQTYAIEGRSRFFSYTLETQVEKGLLTRVSLDADRSRLRSRAISSTGAALENYLSERTSQQQSAANEVRKANDALRSARLNVAKAKASLASVEQHPDDDEEIIQAKLELSHAELELQAAEAALQERRSAAERSAGLFNQPAGTARLSPAFFILADSCDLFALGADGIPTGRVELVALKSWGGEPGPQIRLPEAQWPATSAPPAPPSPVRLRTGTTWRVPGFRSGKALFKTGFVSRIGGIETEGILYQREGQSKAIRPGAVEFRLGTNMKDLDIWFLQQKDEFTMTPGNYTLRLPVLPETGTQPLEITLRIEVVDQ